MWKKGIEKMDTLRNQKVRVSQDSRNMPPFCLALFDNLFHMS